MNEDWEDRYQKADAIESWAAQRELRNVDASKERAEIAALRGEQQPSYPPTVLPRAPLWREAWDGVALVGELLRAWIRRSR